MFVVVPFLWFVVLRLGIVGVIVFAMLVGALFVCRLFASCFVNGLVFLGSMRFLASWLSSSGGRFDWLLTHELTT